MDTWIKTDEYDKEINFNDIEKNFDANTSEYNNIKKFKKNYEIIYVDGFHLGEQVYKDIKNAWKILSEGGYLICDDYIWNTSLKNTETTPFML